MPRPGNAELLLILLVVLLLFGAKRLPDLAKSVGKSLRILKTEVRDHDDDRASAADGTASTVTSAPPTAATPAPTATPSVAPRTPTDATGADSADRQQA